MLRSNVRWFSITALALAATLPARAAPPRAEVNFIEPEKFADIGWNARDREAALKGLGDHLRKLAQGLPEGQALQIDVTNVDLAGEVSPFSVSGLRVLRGFADSPRIALRYTLRDGSRVMKAGEANVIDLAYMVGSRPLGMANDPLAYEKQMLTDWFQRTLLDKP
jgi:hypothetical protein